MDGIGALIVLALLATGGLGLGLLLSAKSPGRRVLGVLLLLAGVAGMLFVAGAASLGSVASH